MVRYVAGEATGSKHICVEGPLDSMASALFSLRYKPDSHYFGNDELKIVASDLAGLAVFSGGICDASHQNEMLVAIKVQEQNDPPKVLTPNGIMDVNEDIVTQMKEFPSWMLILIPMELSRSESLLRKGVETPLRHIINKHAFVPASI